MAVTSKVRNMVQDFEFAWLGGRSGVPGRRIPHRQRTAGDAI